jgi:hypothetical protein
MRMGGGRVAGLEESQRRARSGLHGRGRRQRSRRVLEVGVHPDLHDLYRDLEVDSLGRRQEMIPEDLQRPGSHRLPRLQGPALQLADAQVDKGGFIRSRRPPPTFPAPPSGSCSFRSGFPRRTPAGDAPGEGGRAWGPSARGSTCTRESDEARMCSRDRGGERPAGDGADHGPGHSPAHRRAFHERHRSTTRSTSARSL